MLTPSTSAPFLWNSSIRPLSAVSDVGRTSEKVPGAEDQDQPLLAEVSQAHSPSARARGGGTGQVEVEGRDSDDWAGRRHVAVSRAPMQHSDQLAMDLTKAAAAPFLA